MIVVHSDGVGSGTCAIEAYSSSSIYPTLGIAYPKWTTGRSFNDLISEKRSSIDSLRTGPALFAGDHECDHVHVDAYVSLQPTLSGSLTSWDPYYGISSSYLSEPAHAYGWDLSDLQAAWGTTYSSTKRKQYRRSDLGFCHTATSPYAPFLWGSQGYAMSFGASMSSKATYRFLTSTLLIYAQIATIRGAGYPVVLYYFITAERDWNSSGQQTLGTVTVVPRCWTWGSSRSTGTGYNRYSFDTSQSWVMSEAVASVPSELASLTFDDFVSLCKNPYQLEGIWPSNWSLDVCNVPKFPYMYTTPINVVSTTASEDDLESIHDRIDGYFVSKWPLISSMSPEDDSGKLGDTAADNTLNVAINCIAGAMDLRKMFGTLIQLVKTLSNASNISSWADLWLSLRFGDRLTISDSIDLLKATARSYGPVGSHDFYVSKAMSYQSCSPGTSLFPTGVVRRNLKLYYQPAFPSSVLAGLITRAMQWDVWPSMANMWDIIPLSFVVDWFVDVESFLESIDRNIYKQYLSVLSVLLTTKTTFDLGTYVDVDYLHECTLTLYHRQHLRKLPASPFRIDTGHLSSINIVDGISLLVQANS